VTGVLADRIRESLASSREQADALLLAAERQARELSALAAATDDALVDARIARLADLRTDVATGLRRVGAGYAGMAEALAAGATRLAEASREADFRPPPWPQGIRHTVELKLSETREVTLRIESAPAPPAGRDAAT
jgi:hypothetical protein